MKKLEQFGNYGQYALLAVIGIYALCTSNQIAGLSLAGIGIVQKLIVVALKNYIPRKRPTS